MIGPHLPQKMKKIMLKISQNGCQKRPNTQKRIAKLPCTIAGGGIYQKQQATLIVWTEPDGTDLALSFATAQGCQEIWSFICEAQNRISQAQQHTPASINSNQFHASPRSSSDRHLKLSTTNHQDRIHPQHPSPAWDDDDFQLTCSQPISNHHTRQLLQQHQNPPSVSLEPANQQPMDGSTIKHHSPSSPLTSHNNDDHHNSINNNSSSSTHFQQHVSSIHHHQQYNQLPEPSLTNLDEIENLIRSASRSSLGREKISTLILKKDYLKKLESVRVQAEDLESLNDLHTLCLLLQSILMLNDAAIYEYCLQDDVVLIVASILDYDPEFGLQKASYHADLSDQSRFKQVIPIKDEQIKSKIHLTYRLQYFKDIILARMMDDSTFSIISSMLFFNQVEIVQYLHSNDEFMSELFGIFDHADHPKPGCESQVHQSQHPLSSSPIDGPPLPPYMNQEGENVHVVESNPQTVNDRKIDTILFLQQFCSMAKNLQAPSRINVFRSLAERGILKVIEFGLSKENLIATSNDDPQGQATPLSPSASSTNHDWNKEIIAEEWMIRSIACEILMTIIDYDPISVRSYCLKQRDLGVKSLVECLIELILNPKTDLGLKVQLTDALRILLDMTGTGSNSSNSGSLLQNDSNHLMISKRDEDPENEKFLQFFYDHCIHLLAAPFLNLPDFKPASSADDTHSENVSVLIDSSEAATFNHLSEIICFIIVNHSFRSKYFILSTNLLNKIGSLLAIITRKKYDQYYYPANKSRNKQQPSQQEFKYLELIGLKILKSCLNKQDEYYDRSLIKNNLINQVILRIFLIQNGKDNLVSSACLEFFEFIRSSNPKAIINHLMEKEEAQIKELAVKYSSFDHIITRFNRNNDRPDHPQLGQNPHSHLNPNEEQGANNSSSRNIGPWNRTKTLEAEEESYFNEASDDDDDDQGGTGKATGEGTIASSTRGETGKNKNEIKESSKSLTSHKRSRSMTRFSDNFTSITPSGHHIQKAIALDDRSTSNPDRASAMKPLVDYPDEDDPETKQPTKSEEGQTMMTTTTNTGLSGAEPPKVRLGERRRREEDEEDQNGLGGLLLSGGTNRESKRGKKNSFTFTSAGAMSRSGITPKMVFKTTATGLFNTGPVSSNNLQVGADIGSNSNSVSNSDADPSTPSLSSNYPQKNKPDILPSNSKKNNNGLVGGKKIVLNLGLSNYCAKSLNCTDAAVGSTTLSNSNFIPINNHHGPDQGKSRFKSIQKQSQQDETKDDPDQLCSSSSPFMKNDNALELSNNIESQPLKLTGEPRNSADEETCLDSNSIDTDNSSSVSASSVAQNVTPAPIFDTSSSNHDLSSRPSTDPMSLLPQA